MRLVPRLWLGGLVGACAVLLLSCTHSPDPETVTGVVVRVDKPDALPYEQAKVTLAGSETEVNVSREVDGPRVSFLLKVKDTLIDTERYLSRDGRFLVTEIAGTKFDPPIPLLPNPVRVPEETVWEGTLTSGATPEKAKANVSRDRESLNVSGGPFDTVKVTVKLMTTPTSGPGVERDMMFWFVSGRGIIQRQFADVSTRSPS